MNGFRVIQLFFPDGNYNRQGPESSVYFERRPHTELVRVITPTEDLDYGESEKPIIFGRISLDEQKLRRLRNGNCLLVEDNKLYRITRVEMYANRQHTCRVWAVDDGREVVEVEEFVRAVIAGRPVTIKGLPAGVFAHGHIF